MYCFIASALGYDDVDKIFDVCIRPVLLEHKIRPLRVDRVEHNEDIDDEIFKLIDKSTICIADLTYARPSVYYEAGFAFGVGKPVIYIVRKDHFKPRENDPAGNLRIHFDLQMKNIIPWILPNEAFKKRLRQRLNYIIRPIQKERQVKKIDIAAERDFASKSQIERLTDLLNKARNILKANGYTKAGILKEGPFRLDPFHDAFQKTKGKTYKQVLILIRPNIKQTSLQGIGYFPLVFLSKEEIERIKCIKSICIVISLNKARPKTLMALLPEWTPISDHHFQQITEYPLRKEIPHYITIAFIDGIKSLGNLAETFKEVLMTMENDINL